MSHDQAEIEDYEKYLGRTPEEQWRDHELSRANRIREDAKQPLGVNLARGLAHSEALLSFVGSAIKK